MTTFPFMMVLAVITAIAATVLAFIFIVPESKREKLGKIGALLHDIFQFKFLILEKIMQALYIFATAICICCGLFMFLSFDSSRWGFHWYGGYGLLLILIGPIVVRLVYEGLMLAILLVKNVIQINSKLKSQNDGENDPFAIPSVKSVFKKEPVADTYQAPVAQQPVAPQPAAAQPVAPKPMFCTSCGAQRNPDGSCPNGCK